MLKDSVYIILEMNFFLFILSAMSILCKLWYCRKIKITDIRHNLSLVRLDCLVVANGLAGFELSIENQERASELKGDYSSIELIFNQFLVLFLGVFVIHKIFRDFVAVIFTCINLSARKTDKKISYLKQLAKKEQASKEYIWLMSALFELEKDPFKCSDHHSFLNKHQMAHNYIGQFINLKTLKQLILQLENSVSLRKFKDALSQSQKIPTMVLNYAGSKETKSRPAEIFVLNKKFIHYRGGLYNKEEYSSAFKEPYEVITEYVYEVKSTTVQLIPMKQTVVKAKGNKRLIVFSEDGYNRDVFDYLMSIGVLKIHISQLDDYWKTRKMSSNDVNRLSILYAEYGATVEIYKLIKQCLGIRLQEFKALQAKLLKQWDLELSLDQVMPKIKVLDDDKLKIVLGNDVYQNLGQQINQTCLIISKLYFLRNEVIKNMPVVA